MARKLSEIQAEVADRLAIADTLARFCRGIDRLDEEMLRSIYWEDATDNHVGYVGTASGFIDHILPILRMTGPTSHLVGNTIIEISGSSAKVESYFSCHQLISGGDASSSVLLLGGRYLDRMEKRDDEWRISDRVLVIDWFRQYEDPMDWSAGFPGVAIKPGSRKPEDISYQLFAA